LSKNQKIPMDGEAILDVLQTKSGTLYVMSGSHYSFKALRLMHEVIRPHAQRKPSQWLFLVEGSPKGDIPEVIYGYLMGEKLGIPTENPIKDPYNKEVVERAIKSGMEPEDVYLALSVEMLQVVPHLDQVVSRLSKEWDVSPDYLRGLITYLLWEAQTNPEAMSRKKEEFRGIRSEIIGISNELSSQELDRIVAKYRDRNKIFVYLGRNHRKILDRNPFLFSRF
jgi:hypothetical protein